MVGLHDSVTMSFMLVGHTKFCQDWCFGLLKQRYKTFVCCLQDIVDVVNSSADVNTAQLASMQDGEVVVPTYDWAQFLGEHCRKVPQMKSYHHFFSRDAPGVVALKKFRDSSSTTFRILADSSWKLSADDLPPQILPSGLSNEWQWYLYRKIREFCRPGTEDLVCPLPSTPLQDDPITDGDGDGGRLSDDEETRPPPTKRIRCGICGNSGHTRRTCPEKRQ